MRYHEVLRWLNDGDPVVRYQVHRDFMGSPQEELDLLQLDIELSEGWVKHILDEQEEFGSWIDDIQKNKWKATLWTLTLLKRFEVSPYIIKAQLGARVLLENGQQMDGGFTPIKGELSDVCISAHILNVLSYFRIKDPRREAIFEFLIEKQNDDGGWGCENGDSSMQATFIVLEALQQYRKVSNKNITTVHTLIEKAQEFLLSNELFMRNQEGGIDERCIRFCFPAIQQYNILDVLDYFQSIDHRYDMRFEKAVALVSERKTERNVWKLEYIPKGMYWQLYEELGESLWITLKAMRVERWWKKKSKFKH